MSLLITAQCHKKSGQHNGYGYMMNRRYPMTKSPTPSPVTKSAWLLEELQELLVDEDSLAIKDFGEVSDSFVEGYSRFIHRGIPGKTIGLVMIGATINVYSMFGMSEELPDTLRMIADKLEDKGPHH